MGTGMESSSFKYGHLNQSVVEYNVLTSDNNSRKIKCNKNQNKDLYDSIPGSFGTLVILTSVKVKLKYTLPYITLFAKYKNIKMQLIVCLYVLIKL